MVAVMCVAAAVSLGNAQTPSGQTGGKPSGTQSADKPADKGQTAAKGKTAKADQGFVREAAMSGMAEVELGRLAADKASNADVKKFGQRMVDDHGKANDELKGIASGKTLDLPTSLGPKHMAIRDKLAKLSGDAFDRAYMAEMVRDHDQAVQLFQRASKSGSDAEIKAFAEKHLPHLREHQKMARDLSSKVRGSAKAAEKKPGAQ